MGTLFLPSLEEKRFITIDDISVEEADEFLQFFDAQVKAKRKIGVNANPPSNASLSMNLYYNIVNFDTNIIPIMGIFGALQLSEIPGQRGARAVFVDYDNNLIGVGTTVVYNRNWAMFGVEDSSIVSIINGLDEDDDDHDINVRIDW